MKTDKRKATAGSSIPCAILVLVLSLLEFVCLKFGLFAMIMAMQKYPSLELQIPENEIKDKQIQRKLENLLP
jgi:hypothetical protein